MPDNRGCLVERSRVLGDRGHHVVRVIVGARPSRVPGNQGAGRPVF